MEDKGREKGEVGREKGEERREKGERGGRKEGELPKGYPSRGKKD